MCLRNYIFASVFATPNLWNARNTNGGGGSIQKLKKWQRGVCVEGTTRLGPHLVWGWPWLPADLTWTSGSIRSYLTSWSIQHCFAYPVAEAKVSPSNKNLREDARETTWDILAGYKLSYWATANHWRDYSRAAWIPPKGRKAIKFSVQRMSAFIVHLKRKEKEQVPSHCGCKGLNLSPFSSQCNTW